MEALQDHELLTQVGPGTMMGRMMREYWIPACGSAELAADGPPLRLVLLGEKLIAFRDSGGRVGVLDHRCPHRCASLFLGRNEANGLRCAYHGWKFDVAGNCLDMPNVPPRHSFAAKVRAKAYQTIERNGIVWTYMGERAEAPPLPALEPLLLPETEMRVAFVQRECNWVQALEGDIDTSHFGFLHDGMAKAGDFPPDSIRHFMLADRAPDYHMADMDWGMMYAAYRPAGPSHLYYRIAHFLFPFWTMIPAFSFGHHIVMRGWVPMDDTHTMFMHFSWKGNGAPLPMRNDGGSNTASSFDYRYQPNTTDWYGRWRLIATQKDDWGIDRELQRRSSFTGITGIHLQDQAVTESMGPIVDRSWEHLTISDLMITRTRRRLLRAARDLADAGVTPPGVDDPEICLGAHSGDYVAPASLPWQRAYANELKAAANPTGALRIPALLDQDETVNQI
jgi:phthalate 4,5-dioxygenase oxygenase subunit